MYMCSLYIMRIARAFCQKFINTLIQNSISDE